MQEPAVKYNLVWTAVTTVTDRMVSDLFEPGCGDSAAHGVNSGSQELQAFPQVADPSMPNKTVKMRAPRGRLAGPPGKPPPPPNQQLGPPRGPAPSRLPPPGWLRPPDQVQPTPTPQQPSLTPQQQQQLQQLQRQQQMQQMQRQAALQQQQQQQGGRVPEGQVPEGRMPERGPPGREVQQAGGCSCGSQTVRSGSEIMCFDGSSSFALSSNCSPFRYCLFLHVFS